MNQVRRKRILIVDDNAAITKTPSSGVNPPVPTNIPTKEGIFLDDEEKDCQVYADVNDVALMRNTVTADDSEEENNFSKWSFTYTEDYQLIKEGSNELTAKMSCYLVNNPTPLSEWHTVKVTRVVEKTSLLQCSLKN